jgi:hypothetical protein
VERSVAQLIEEACKAISSGRVAAERCALAGDALGRAWRERELDPAALVDEIASVRRFVWETVVARFRGGSITPDALVEARASIDVAFDAALKRAVGMLARDAHKSLEPSDEPPVDPDDEPKFSDFHLALATCVADSVERRTPLALIVLHFDAKVDSPDSKSVDGDLHDLSEILGLQLRHHDRSFALSDSDYALLCPDTGADGAKHLLERITYATRLYSKRGGLAANITGGFAVAPEDGTTPMDLIRIALADREFSLIE